MHGRSDTRARHGGTRRGLMLVPILLTATPAVHAEIIEHMPDAIVCSVRDPTGTLAWDRLVYYVSAHMTTGDTLFKTLTSDPVVLLVGANGIVKGPNLADCDGRSIQSLREDGRAFDITAPRNGDHSPGR